MSELSLKEINELMYTPSGKGKWIPENRRDRSILFYCSVCQKTVYFPTMKYGGKFEKKCRYRFCPWCQTEMEVD